MIKENSVLAVNAQELQRLLSLSRSALYKLCKQKVFVALPHFKRHRLFPFSQVTDFLNPKK